ncbi:MAG: 3-deoxy-7-phosphoheptulonate synthase [Peptococcaceae bacterium]|nr:3-deoxy-7-phosphoheptulonate synthase [Peptococcaceae bacterium]
MDNILTSRRYKNECTVVDLKTCRIGDGSLAIIAGPCAVESMDQMIYLAGLFKKTGVSIIRGGAYKPRTSPYSFQGLGEEGLRILAAAREQTGLPFVTEVTDVRYIEKVAGYADIIQIGSRNMQNFSLLREAGKSGKPVILKRGFSSTLEEWLSAAEYIAAEGNNKIIFCERGIRTFEGYTRNTMDISAIPAIKELSHFPIIADPSHGTGRRSLVGPLAKAAVAAGSDGVMLEVHENPPRALSDGAQSLYPSELESLVPALQVLHAACSSLRKTAV